MQAGPNLIDPAADRAKIVRNPRSAHAGIKRTRQAAEGPLLTVVAFFPSHGVAALLWIFRLVGAL